MGEKCKINECTNPVSIKGYCKAHFENKIQCRIFNCDNLIIYKNGLCQKHYIQKTEGVELRYKKFIRLPKSWSYLSVKNRKDFIEQIDNQELLFHILKRDSNSDITWAAMNRLSRLGCVIPKGFVYGCKIPGCHREPNSLGHFSRGFCHRHYEHYRKKIIDIDGNKLRELVSTTDRNKKRMLHSRILSKFNIIVRELHTIRNKLREIRKLSIDFKDNSEFLKQISFLEDNLKFIYAPVFILNSTSFLNNVTLKRLLGGEKEEPIPVILELGDDKFNGELIKGDNSNIVVTQLKKGSNVVLYLKDTKIPKLPFESKALDDKGNVLHQIRINKLE